MEEEIGAFIPIAIFAMVVLIVFFSAKYRYQTRKAIIEKGNNIEFPKRKYYFLEFGGIMVGIGLGLALAALVQSSGLNNGTKLMMSFALPSFFGGLGLIVAYFIRRKLEKKEQ